MFSEIVKKEVAKVMLAVFVYTNVSPAFEPDYVVNVTKQEVLNEATQQMIGGFIVQVMQRQVAAAATYRTILEEVVAPFMVATEATVGSIARLYEILQKIRATVETVPVETGTDQSGTDETGLPVSEEEEEEREEATSISESSAAAETLPVAESSVAESSVAESSVAESSVTESSVTETPPTEKEVETEISRDCLSIPELGDLLISHEGDVVFDAEKAIGKLIKIRTPAQLVLNNTTATDKRQRQY